MPKVSILLPVYNSIIKTGQTNILPQMLNSILKQTYPNFELLIMDNQSIDNTVEVCKAATKDDPRVKIFVDDEKRSAEEAIHKLFQISTGDYICTLSDDDLLNHRYFELLINETRKNKVDLVYSNGLCIDGTNKVLRPLITDLTSTYTPNQSYCDSFCRAVYKRSVLPTLFGLFKREAFEHLSPNTPFDELRANMDNFLMVNFFLHQYKALFVNYNIFYYRERDRSLNTDDLSYMPHNPMLIWVYYVRHQLYFNNAIYSVIDKTNHENRTWALKSTMLDSCLNQCVNLLGWVARDMLQDGFEQCVLKEIAVQFKPIYDLKFNSFPETSKEIRKQQDMNRLRCKILQERVLGYIHTVVQDTELVENTQEVVGEIKQELIEQLKS